MKPMTRFLGWKVSSEKTDASIAAKGCLVVALLFFAYTTLKLPKLDLDAKELFFGYLLICCCTVQMAVGAALCEVYRHVVKDNGRQESNT